MAQFGMRFWQRKVNGEKRSDMPSPTEEAVLAALKTVQDPELHKDIVTLGMVKDLTVTDGKVSLMVELTTPACPLKDQIKADLNVARTPSEKYLEAEEASKMRFLTHSAHTNPPAEGGDATNPPDEEEEKE